MRNILAVAVAVAATAILMAASAAAQDKPRGRKGGDPRTECLRETEKTYPPRTITRQQRDMHVEACMRKRG
jgi:hypothetical protein